MSLWMSAPLKIFVVGGWIGVFGYDVPSVEEAGDETKHAEEDVDEGVEGAETGFDPYREWWEDYGKNSKENV